MWYDAQVSEPWTIDVKRKGDNTSSPISLHVSYTFYTEPYKKLNVIFNIRRMFMMTDT